MNSLPNNKFEYMIPADYSYPTEYMNYTEYNQYENHIIFIF